MHALPHLFVPVSLQYLELACGNDGLFEITQTLVDDTKICISTSFSISLSHFLLQYSNLAYGNIWPVWNHLDFCRRCQDLHKHTLLHLFVQVLLQYSELACGNLWPVGNHPTLVGVAKICISMSFSISLSQFLCNTQTLLLVIYGLFEIT